MNNKKIIQNIRVGLICKPFSILLNLMIFPLTVNFFSEETYGIWITMFSFVSWINLFDIGIGNGLKNKLTQSLVNKDYKKSREYIATTYIFLLVISILIFLIFFFASYWIEWNKIFNIKTLDSNYIREVVVINIFFICLSFILKTSDSIYFSLHKTSSVAIFQLGTQVVNFLILIIVTRYFKVENKLLVLSLLFGFSNLLVQLLATINIFFKNKKLKFLITDFNKSLINDLLILGGKFFIMQIAGLIIFTTDNIIITQLFGPIEVTPYSITFKIFSLIIMVHGIIMTPLWTAFTQAYHQKNKQWILKIIRQLRILEIFIFIGVIIIYFLFPLLMKYWIKSEINISSILKIGFGYYVVIYTWNSIQSSALNGFGRVEYSYKISLIEGIINIPLSIYLAKNLNMGIAGVIWGTNITLMISAIANYVILKKILKKLA